MGEIGKMMKVYIMPNGRKYRYNEQDAPACAVLFKPEPAKEESIEPEMKAVEPKNKAVKPANKTKKAAKK